MSTQSARQVNNVKSNHKVIVRLYITGLRPVLLNIKKYQNFNTEFSSFFLCMLRTFFGNLKTRDTFLSSVIVLLFFGIDDFNVIIKI